MDEYFHNGRNGRFIKAAVPSGANKKVVKGGGATRHSEPRDLGERKSSTTAMSDTSETVSLSKFILNESITLLFIHAFIH